MQAEILNDITIILAKESSFFLVMIKYIIPSKRSIPPNEF